MDIIEPLNSLTKKADRSRLFLIVCCFCAKYPFLQHS